MSLLIGYARCSTDDQDLTVQRNALVDLGVEPERIYTDHGLTGRNRDRPGLREALAACREGDTLVVTKLDRLARSMSDASDIARDLTGRGVGLQFQGTTYNPNDPIGKLMFGMLAVMAEFESDLIRMRTREGLALAKKRGHLKGKQPKLTAAQIAHLGVLRDDGKHSIRELCELFGVGKSTIYRCFDLLGVQNTSKSALVIEGSADELG
jgi:DNA invertase Pin-like site-specific DNA recombinase